MAKSSEQISKYNTTGGKPDSNLANDTLHLGGIPADEFATEKYVQDYHTDKEALQKQYIDSQDAAKLAEAKAYTDTVVANQDFSSFAKMTDIQVLNRNLTNKINTDIAEVEQETDAKINAVVRDVNEFNDDTTREINTIKGNINSINGNISNLQRQINTEKTARANADTNLSNRVGSVEGDVYTLQQTTEQLFTSVSNGKRNVAAAITGKGVPTASDATFNVMANNIGLIETGIDTSDATATEEDIMFGKTAYAQGSKKYGTHRDLDTSDATATDNDIMEGKTAYVNGIKIYGSHTDLDTSDATATNNDILFGKTAYANGIKLYGTHIDLDTSDATATNEDIAMGKTAYVNGSKIYGSHYETGVDTSDATATPYDLLLGKTAYVNGEKITGILDMSGATPTYGGETGVEKIYGSGVGNYRLGNIYKNGNQPNNATFALYDTSEEQVIVIVRQGTNELYMDYVQDSGIANTQTIDISSVKQEVQNRLSQYSDYSGVDAGVHIVGVTKLNTSKPFIAMTSIYSYAKKEMILALLPLVEVHTPYNGGTVITYDIDFNNIVYHNLTSSSSFNSWVFNIEMSEIGDRIISTMWDINIDVDNFTIESFKPLNINITANSIIPTFSASKRIIAYNEDRGSYGVSCVLLDDSLNQVTTINLVSYSGTVTSDFKYLVTRKGEIYQLQVDFDNYQVTKTLIKTGTAIDNDYTVFMRFLGNKFIIADKNMYDKIFYFNPLENEPLQLFDETTYYLAYSGAGNIGRTVGDSMYYYTYTGNDSPANKFRYVSMRESFSELVALRYNGEYFYRQDNGILTAGQPDVREGKSFIGWMGYPEVGTMQVQEEEE